LASEGEAHLDEVGTSQDADDASIDDLFSGQCTTLEDDLEDGSTVGSFVNGLHHGSDVIKDSEVVSVLEESHVDNHIDLLGSVVVNQLASLRSFGSWSRCSEWEANHCGNVDAAALEVASGGFDSRSVDTDRDEVVLLGFVGELRDFLLVL